VLNSWLLGDNYTVIYKWKILILDGGEKEEAWLNKPFIKFYLAENANIIVGGGLLK